MCRHTQTNSYKQTQSHNVCGIFPNFLYFLTQKQVNMQQLLLIQTYTSWTLEFGVFYTRGPCPGLHYLCKLCRMTGRSCSMTFSKVLPLAYRCTCWDFSQLFCHRSTEICAFSQNAQSHIHVLH